MGQKTSRGVGSSCSNDSGKLGSTQFAGALERVKHRHVSGRYHLLPKKLTDDYEVQNTGAQAVVLGSGFNGDVFMATKKSNPMAKFAVKSFNIASLPASTMATLESEIEIFLSMDHPHVARLMDVYETEDRLELIMECMEGGELFDRVTQLKKFGENDAADAVWQMLLSLNYIHTHGVVHRDLKLENFLYETKDGRHLKLIDFGFSKIWDPTVAMQLSCGTLSYVAPEVLRKKYTSQCDLWSLGVLTFILISGYMPFHGSDKDQTQRILKGSYVMKPEKWGPISSECKEFTRSLLQVDPEIRLTAATALQHPWIANREQLGKAHISNIDSGVVDALREYRNTSKFRKTCMEMMAWSLSTEERAKVREYFIAMDTEGKGTITLQQLKTVLVDRFDMNDEDSAEVFNALHTSGHEVIYYSDFLAAMVSTRIALHDDLLHSAFMKFDVDNSGYITSENLKKILGEALSGDDVATLMEEADQLKDGRISYAEFVSYLRGTPLKSHAEAATSVIDVQVREQGRRTSLRLRNRSGDDGDRRRKRDVVKDRCSIS